MADNALTVVAADSSTKTLRSRDVGSGVQSQKVDVGPWVPTTAATADNVYSQTVSSSVVTLTTPTGSTHVLVTVENDAVRYTEDGSTPTATDGLLLPDGFIGELPCPNDLKFIRVTTDAVINASFRSYD